MIAHMPINARSYPEHNNAAPQPGLQSHFCHNPIRIYSRMCRIQSDNLLHKGDFQLMLPFHPQSIEAAYLMYI